jgi:glycosyltransferase involved in cell wall biosynthesis
MPIPVLFMQSQSYFGADSEIHAQLMRHFDRSMVEVHVACNHQQQRNPALTAYKHVCTIPQVHVRPTDFGPSVHGMGGIHKIKKAAGGLAVPLRLGALASYIRRHNIQIIHGTEKPRDAFYGVLLGKITGARSVVHMHVNYGEWQSRLVKWALRRADAIVGVSRFTAQSIVNAGLPCERVFAVLNSLDLLSSRWDPGLDGRSVRQQFGIAQDAPVLGITARLFRWKGHSDLLDALALVKKQMPNVRLVIVGEDDPRANPGGGSYRAELESQIRHHDLGANVLFTGFRTDVPELMASFDVYAMPSWEEPFGMVFIEAMAMKKPVIAWDIGGAKEIIMHNETGLLVEPKSTPDLAEAILKLLRDPALRQRMGEAGRRRVEQAFTSQRMCQDMIEVYQKILGSKAHSSLEHVTQALQ